MSVGKSHGSKDCGENADIKHPPAELLTRSYYDVSDTIRNRSHTRLGGSSVICFTYLMLR